MLLYSHAGDLLLVQKNRPAGGIIPQHGVSHTLISSIFREDFQHALPCLSAKAPGNLLTHSIFPVNVSVSMATSRVQKTVTK